jgi:hypothetical protein
MIFNTTCFDLYRPATCSTLSGTSIPSGRRVLRGMIVACWAKGSCVNLLREKWGYVNADSYRHTNPLHLTYVRFGH